MEIIKFYNYINENILKSIMKINKFDNYINENLLKGKREDQLPKGAVMLLKVRNMISEFGLKPSDIKHANGTWFFTISIVLNKTVIAYYYDRDEMVKYYTTEYLNTHTDYGFLIRVNTEIVYPDKNTVESMTIKILDVCFPNIINVINNTQKRIDELQNEITRYKEFVSCLKKAKNFKDEN